MPGLASVWLAVGLVLQAAPPVPPGGHPPIAPALTEGEGRLVPVVAGVDFDRSGLDAAVADFWALQAQVTATQATWRHAVAAIEELDDLERRLTAQRTAARGRHEAAVATLGTLRAGVHELAIARYVSGSVALDPSVGIDETTEYGSRRVLVDAVRDHDFAAIEVEVSRRDRAAADTRTAETLLAATRRRRLDAELVRDTAAAAAIGLSADLSDAWERTADARVTGFVTGTDFQVVALDAYVRGAMALVAEYPHCGLRWELLAAIARVESHHGTWLGERLEGDGRTSGDILGLRLDGSSGTAVVWDSDGGVLDGDPVYDRAVGPFGFLPSSWVLFGGDLDGDGEADPHNVYDAALGAGRHLCRATTRLGDPDDLEAALLSYNRSTVYGETVLAYLAGYDTLTLW